MGPTGFDGVSVRRSTILDRPVLGKVPTRGTTMSAAELLMRARNRTVGYVSDVVGELTMRDETAASARQTA